MEYIMIILVFAVPAIAAALIMKPNFKRYSILSMATGFIFALIVIDIPQFIGNWNEIRRTEHSLSNWTTLFVWFLLSSAFITMITQSIIGGFKKLKGSNQSIVDNG